MRHHDLLVARTGPDFSITLYDTLDSEGSVPAERVPLGRLVDHLIKNGVAPDAAAAILVRLLDGETETVSLRAVPAVGGF